MTRIDTLIRSCLLGALAATGMSIPATPSAAGQEELNPSDLVPRRFSVERYSKLSDNEIYDVLIAVRRGRGIRIDGCTVSQSTAIIRASKSDPEASRRQAITTCG